jgi:hypothetical protein
MINYDDFQHVNFVFSQNFISLFRGLFDDKTDLRVRVDLKSTSVGSPKEGETLEFTRRKEGNNMSRNSLKVSKSRCISNGNFDEQII